MTAEQQAFSSGFAIGLCVATLGFSIVLNVIHAMQRDRREARRNAEARKGEEAGR